MVRIARQGRVDDAETITTKAIVSKGAGAHILHRILTNWSAAPFVFFSPPSSKLENAHQECHSDDDIEDVLFAALEGELHLVLAYSAL